MAKNQNSKAAQREAELNLKLSQPWQRVASLEETKKVLKQMIDLAERDKKILYTGTILAKFGLENSWIAKKTKQFPEDEEVQHMIGYLKVICESRLFEGSVNGMLKERTCLFTLSAHYGWKANTAIDVTTDGQALQAVTPRNYTTEELLLLESINKAAEARANEQA